MRTVADLIETHHTEIMHAWTEMLERGVSAQELSVPELASLMPEFLSLLGRNGVEPQRGLSEAQYDLIERHLSNRLGQGFELNEILDEFGMIGTCVSRFFSTESPDEQPGAGDVAHFHDELRLTSTAITRIFTEHLLEDQQSEKRLSRLLKNRTGPHDRAPMRKRLTAALTLVMKAMGAQTAAMLLFDATSRRLILSASVGDVDERIATSVSPLDPASFVGKIAANDQATAVGDVETTELAVSDELRQSGIHSLLGIRLSAHDVLHGVLYVGLRERRRFTASESRRLVSLGETLALYVENAQLYAALNHKLGELRTEAALRDRFVDVLMHDLTGPLTSARLSAQRLLQPDGAPDPGALAAKIVHGLGRVEAMVGDLLDAHRIRAGQRLPLRIDDCNLGALVREVVGELRGLHGDRFLVRTAKDVRGMWSADQLRRAVWNLSTNAIRHGAAGAPVTITVKKTGEKAQLHVHNQGPAIAADELARLVQPFQGTRVISDGHSGWGLGLTLVWGCAEAHGGNVIVESLPDAGTTFTLELPFDARPYSDSAS